MYFYMPFLFFKVFFNFTSVAKAAFHISFSLIKRHFCMYFYMPFLFFKVFFNFNSVSKAAFRSLERLVVPPKEEKCHFSFFLIKRHFCMYFYVPFHFFKLFFNFPFVAKAAFCKSRVHRGTPRGGEMSHLFFSNKTAFLHVFLHAISFFQSLFQFYFRCKSSILQV